MAVEMASTKFSYQRLVSVGDFEEEGGRQGEKGLGRTRSWRKLRRLSSTRRRPRLRIPRLKRFLRRKSRQLSASWTKVWKRLKEGRNHIGDLFAGNYMFMQVSPTPLGYLDRSFMGPEKHYHGMSIPTIHSLKRIA